MYVVVTRDKENRQEFKDRLLNKVETSLTPPVEVIEEPVEIIERYAKGVPFELEPMEGFFPEVKEPSPGSFILDSDVLKRTEVKNKLRKKALTVPVEVIEEPVQVEIIDKYAKGISFGREPMEGFFPEVKNPIPGSFLLDSDIPKRNEVKDKLRKKVALARIHKSEITPVEIIDYSQRSLTIFEPEFESLYDHPLVVSSEPESSASPGPSVNETEALVKVLRLPDNYESLDEGALYGVLIRRSDLRHTSESANLALDVLAGRVTTPVEFEIVPSTPSEIHRVPVTPAPSFQQIQDQFKPQDAEKRAAFVSGLLSRVDNLLNPSESVETESPDPISREPLSLPDYWDRTPLSVLRTDLLNSGGTPEQVDELLASIANKPKVEKVLPVFIREENTQVDLPEGFGSWRLSEQYTYLTRVQKLTPERANSIMYEGAK